MKAAASKKRLLTRSNNGIISNKIFLPPVRQNWVFSIPIYSAGDKPQQQNGGGVPPMEFAYGPFSIGASQWQMEFRLPSKEIFLKRVRNGAINNKETLSFQIIAEHGGKRRVFPLKNCVFTEGKPEVCCGRWEPPICESSPFSLYSKQIRLVFEAIVRPEKFAGGLACDVRLVVLQKSYGGGKKKEGKQLVEYAAHRSVLAEGSAAFRKMFQQDPREGSIRIGNFAPETIRLLLGFIYTRQNVIEGKPYKKALELLHAAEEFKIVDNALKKQCGARLLQLIDSENAVELLTVAELYGLTELKDAALAFVRDNRRKLCRPKNNGELRRLSPDLLIELINAFSKI